MTTPAKIEPWMVEAVKEMMVKHLGFGAFVGTNWMLLESDLVASIAAHAPTIEEWFERGRRAAFQANNKGGCGCVIDDNDDVLEVCAAHADWCKSYAPKQEPRVPVSELKHAFDTCESYQEIRAWLELQIRQAEQEGKK